MKESIFKKTAFSSLRSGLSPILFTLIVMVMIVFGLHQTEQSSNAKGLRILEEGILHATIKCYAIEGSYPSDISHIEQHYGVYIDRTKYMVTYEAYARNILPSITVIEHK